MKWVHGTDLTDSQRKEALARFVHRSLVFKDDAVWLANTKFMVTKGGRLAHRRSCYTCGPKAVTP